jgi:plastocyanin
VAVALQNVAFVPQKIIVSPDTKVVWTNQNGFAHFVNSDPHPSHNSVAALNSTALQKDESYSFTFTAPGIYGYHCSAHTNMTAQVLVEG